MLWLPCHRAMSLPKVKCIRLHLHSFSIQKGNQCIVSDKWVFAKEMRDCCTCVSFRVRVFGYVRTVVCKTRLSLSVSPSHSSTEVSTLRMQDSLPALCFSPQARNEFCIFKDLKTLRRLCDRDLMWPAKPKLFTIWPFTEKKKSQPPGTLAEDTMKIL